MNAKIKEERFQFVKNLYQIRKQYPRMGLFQPDFIYVIFKSIMPSKYDRSDEDIKRAADDWCSNSIMATEKYGHISKWNTSLVTNMQMLFYSKPTFSEDISKWDVSNVRNMNSMFNSTPFRGDISRWNVSNVTDMSHMFQMSRTFNGDISTWNVSSVTNMKCMFHKAESFNRDLSKWNVSNVTIHSYMIIGSALALQDADTENNQPKLKLQSKIECLLSKDRLE